MSAEPELDLSKGLTRSLLEVAVDEDPVLARALDLIHKLEQLAPAVAAWRRLRPEERGPLPPVAPAIEPEVKRLMLEMNEISAQLEAAVDDGPTVH